MNDVVVEAFKAVPRAGFLRRGTRRRASYDGPISIGHRQTNSQPRTVENMLRLLDVQSGQRVLDVGSGSGWTTALLGHLTGPDGLVIGLELEPDLVEFGATNLARHNLPWTSIRAAEPGVLGLPEEGPFDRILVSAEAQEMPDALVDQLSDDGVLVIPVARTMTRVVNPGARVSEHGNYRFVPLR